MARPTAESTRDREYIHDETGAPERRQSLGVLFSELTDQLTTLMRREVQLARVETQESISAAVKSATSMIAGGAIAYAGLIVLLLAAAFGLASWVPLWISALVVGLITVVIGGLIFMAGRRAMQEVNVVPEKTITTVQNNVEMVKEKVQ